MWMIASPRKGALALLAAAVAVAVCAWRPLPAHAHSRSRDPMAQWEQQKRQTERRKSKRREDLDAQGAETRDAKKSSEDSRQNSQLNDFGEPNTQIDRWRGLTGQ